MEIKGLDEAEKIIASLTNNDSIVEIINTKLNYWNLLENFPNKNLSSEVFELFTKLSNDIFENTSPQYPSFIVVLHWIVFNKIHDDILPQLKVICAEEDLLYFEKFRQLDKMNVSAEDFGGAKDLSISLSTPVVEFSVLDRYQSPIEKLQCLYSTFDLLFAELKTVMVSFISKYSDKDQEIPIINNDDIIPILMVVIIKSKTRYLYTNFFYMKNFSFGICKHWEIIKAFEKAINNIKSVDVGSLKLSFSERMRRNIDLMEFMRMTGSENKEQDLRPTLLKEEKERIVNQIVSSTAENIATLQQDNYIDT